MAQEYDSDNDLVDAHEVAKESLTITGNLVSDPKHGVGENGRPFVRIRVAENTRVFNDETKTWGNGKTTFLNAFAYGRLAENISASLKEGDAVMVTGRLREGNDYIDSKTGETRKGEPFISAREVGAGLSRNSVTVHKRATVEPVAVDANKSVDVSHTGPITQAPVTELAAGPSFN